MRKVFFASLLVGLSFFASTVTAQSFEGKVTMQIEYEEVPEEVEPYVGMLPKENIMYIKGSKSCTEQNMMGGSTTTVMDSESGKGFMILNMMGKKDAFDMNTSDATKSETKPTITYVEETKDVAGYQCKKAEVKFEGMEEVMVVWYTEEISGFNSQVQGVKGFPMEYSVNNKGMVMTISVSSVSKETVSDSKFTLPEGMTLKPQSELLKMGMGG